MARFLWQALCITRMRCTQMLGNISGIPGAGCIWRSPVEVLMAHFGLRSGWDGILQFATQQIMEVVRSPLSREWRLCPELP